MNQWYYRDGDQKVGPFDRSALGKLKDAGIISDSTLVKTLDGEQWAPFEELLSREESTQPPETSPETVTRTQESHQPPPFCPNVEYFYLDANRQPTGPLDREALSRLYFSGRIPRTTLVSRKGDKEWSPLSSVLSLSSRTIQVPKADKKPGFTLQIGISRAPIWPWIVCGVSALIWLLSLAWESSIKHQARPLVNEMNRMQSSDYQLEAVLESVYRGYEGDPFGKADEEDDKSSRIDDKLAQLGSDYSTAKTSAGIWFVVALASAAAGFWLRQRSQTFAFPASVPIWSIKYWWG